VTGPRPAARARPDPRACRPQRDPTRSEEDGACGRWPGGQGRNRGSAGAAPDAVGSALLPVLLLMLLFSAIALGSASVIRLELLIQERFAQGAEGLYAAEAGMAAALAELRQMPSWTPVLDGSRTSAFSEGALVGEKVLPSGRMVICCTPGSLTDRLERESAASAVAARRVLRWRPFLWTRFSALPPAAPRPPLMVVVWVADDEAEADGDVEADENGVVIVRAEAVNGALRRGVEAHVAQPSAGGPAMAPPGGPFGAIPPGAVAVARWRELR
jgi:hypothetical protein